MVEEEEDEGDEYLQEEESIEAGDQRRGGRKGLTRISLSQEEGCWLMAGMKDDGKRRKKAKRGIIRSTGENGKGEDGKEEKKL